MKGMLIVVTAIALLVLPAFAALAVDCNKGVTGESMAASEPAAAVAEVTDAAGESVVGTVVNVGNKICPVSGEQIGSMGEAIVVEYEGKAYNLCCAGCVAAFNSDPQKYIGIVNQELEASQ
jgi:YHS domain-containing protein